MPTNDQLPPEVLDLLRQLWAIEQPLVVHIRPRDAWVVLGIIQFASRNPALTADQLQLITAFGRQLQQALARLAPAAAPYLEQGWDPRHDRPRDN